MSGKAGPDALFPDMDAPLLRAAFDRLGASSAVVAWDDERQPWPDFDVVVVRSTWDSVDRPSAFVGWATRVNTLTTLVNPAHVIAATIDKTFMSNLSRAGVAMPRTEFVGPDDAWEPPADDFVVKPTISAGGRETAVYRPSELDAAQAHINRLHNRGASVMVQEYLPAITGRGEIKNIFIGGELSHAIRSGPFLNYGAGVLERPWEVPTGAVPVEPTNAELAFAYAALRELETQLSTELTYARVDVVSLSEQEVVLMEVEAIDPSLSLWASATAPDRLARALLRAAT